MKENIRLVQLVHPEKGRRVALVQEPLLLMLHNVASVYQLALEALEQQTGMHALVKSAFPTKPWIIMRYMTVEANGSCCRRLTIRKTRLPVWFRAPASRIKTVRLTGR